MKSTRSRRPAMNCFETLESRQLLTANFLKFDSTDFSVQDMAVIDDFYAMLGSEPEAMSAGGISE